MSVEPYIELSYTNRDGYERLLINTGLGPARIETVDVSIDGKDVTNWSEVRNILATSEDTQYIYSGLWKGRQIKAGETLALIHIKESEVAKGFQQNYSKVNMKICYCSMYRECWIKEDHHVPIAVEACPADSQTSFPIIPNSSVQ